MASTNNINANISANANVNANGDELIINTNENANTNINTNANANANSNANVNDDASISSFEGDLETPADEQPNEDASPSLQEYMEDDNKVPPAKRVNYLLTLCYANVDMFNPRNFFPYSEFFDRRGYKTTFKCIKGHIVQEMRRRDKTARPNASNNSVEQLLARLLPLDNEVDKQYVIDKEMEYREVLLALLRQEEEEVSDNARMRAEDRYRFTILLDTNEDAYAAYLRSQQCLTREELDAGQSGAGTEFWEMAVAMLNEDDWVPETKAMPDLHSAFSHPIICERGAYLWTMEKGKRFVNDSRRNLTDMIRRYEISGNGANQATHDDSDNEIDETDENWGRFNAGRAARVAERHGGTSDGDDRATYLRHLPVDWLYMWDVFDKRNIIRFTCAQLSQALSASSHAHATPSPTSRGRSRQSNQISNGQVAQNQREMVSSVQNIGVSIADMGRAAKIRRIDQLRSERYRVALVNAAATSTAEENVHEIHMQELTEQIDEAKREVYGDHAPVNDGNAPAAAPTNN